MAKDIRHYAKFTLDFPTNPKILPLSDAAFRCLVEATIWSCEHQTDGFLPSRLALARWSLENLRELCATDDDHPTLLESDKGWYIRDFCEHQATKAEILARQEHAKIAGQRGGLAKAKQSAKQSAKRTSSEVLSKNVPTKAKAKDQLDPYGSSGLGASASRTVNGATRDPAADEAIRRCGLCDNRGYIGLRAGPFIPCPHDPKQIEELEQQNADAF